jgi:hypothetical protein
MKRVLTLETIYDEIPFLTRRNLAAALQMRDELRPAQAAMEAALVGESEAGRTATYVDPLSLSASGEAPDEGSTASLLEALERDVLPYLAARHPKRALLFNQTRADEFFRTLRLRVAPIQQAQVDQLAGWCEERRQMLLQARYHRWMQGWLLVHVPASFLLIILTGWHAVVALFVY